MKTPLELCGHLFFLFKVYYSGMVDYCRERRTIKRNFNNNFNNLNINLNIIEVCDNEIFWRGNHKFFFLYININININISINI